MPRDRDRRPEGSSPEVLPRGVRTHGQEHREYIAMSFIVLPIGLVVLGSGYSWLLLKFVVEDRKRNKK